MNTPSKYLDQAIEQMASLPGIGKRTAMRLVLQLMQRNEEDIQAFADAFIAMKEHVKSCQHCGNLSDFDICSICNNPNRDEKLICVVEDIQDVLAIESTNSFKGLYHVLGGVISPMDGIGPEDLSIQLLLDRVSSNLPNEIIFALSSTMEGDTTNFYLYKKLKDSGVVISTLSRGVSVGTELQYADQITLSRSIINRHPFQSEL